MGQPARGCDERNLASCALLSDGTVAHRREELLAKLLVFREGRCEVGRARGVLFERLCLCASEHQVSFPRFLSIYHGELSPNAPAETGPCGRKQLVSFLARTCRARAAEAGV